MRRTRTHYPRGTREQLIAEYETGAAGPDEFAASRGIRPATFRTWLSRRKVARSKRQGATAVKFVEVETSSGRGSEIEIRVGPVSLRVPSGVGAGFVAELVTRLSQSC